MMLSLAGMALAARAIAGSRAELMGALGNLRHVSWAWVSLAVLAEGCSFAAVALAQRRLLRAGGVTVRARFLGSLAVASQAIGSVLPAGYLTSNVVVLGVMARRGVGKMMTLWMLAVAGFLYIVALVVIGLVGAQLAGAGRNAPNLRPIGAVVLGVMAAAVVAGMVVGRLRRHPWSVHELAARMPGGPLKRLIGGDVLAKVSLGPRGWGAGFLWVLLYWTGDVACLAMAFPAVAGTTPWRGLLLAYAAGQLAALLPVTPGGLGVTEGSMGLALAAYGAGSGALSAVLLYRLIAYWAVLPAGGACYLWLLRRRPDRSRPAAR